MKIDAQIETQGYPLEVCVACRDVGRMYQVSVMLGRKTEISGITRREAPPKLTQGVYQIEPEPEMTQS